MLSGITQGTGNNAINFSYEYDSRGNITNETRNNKATMYSYDTLGQLIRVNDPSDTTSGSAGTTWMFNYDRGGNIVSKVRYSYTTGTLGSALQTISYSYTDSNWKDKLTVFNGQTITYDAIGNPLNDGTWTYQWQAGRQLKQMAKTGTTVEFKYDHNGLRTQKKVTSSAGTVSTDYILNGTKISRQIVKEVAVNGSETIYRMQFFYDKDSKPAMISFKDSMYTYIYNLQGDIVGLVNGNGEKVIEYYYDTWGKELSVETLSSEYNLLAELNPFTYRGYVYDKETSLYYLQTRYYNPNQGRFMNADSILMDSGNIIGQNLYCYCNNSPYILVDPSGMWPGRLIRDPSSQYPWQITGTTDTSTALINRRRKKSIQLMASYGYDQYVFVEAAQKYLKIINPNYRISISDRHPFLLTDYGEITCYVYLLDDLAAPTSSDYYNYRKVKLTFDIDNDVEPYADAGMPIIGLLFGVLNFAAGQSIDMFSESDAFINFIGLFDYVKIG